jgi:deazaflavin-dependent oxidoreductase (nitroreductase family)
MTSTATTATWWNWGIVRALGRVAASLHTRLYRASDGRLGGTAKGVPLALLTTRGRKSGRPYTWPVGYVVDGDNLLLVASAGGAPRNPGWYYNLRANPDVSIQIGQRTRRMIAEPLSGAARATYWEGVLQQHPVFAGYQRKVRREIPVVLLRPADG